MSEAGLGEANGAEGLEGLVEVVHAAALPRVDLEPRGQRLWLRQLSHLPRLKAIFTHHTLDTRDGLNLIMVPYFQTQPKGRWNGEGLLT